MLSDKQSVEEVLIERTVNTTFQMVHDKGLFENYANVDEVLRNFLFIRRRPDLQEVNDIEVQWFCL